MGAEILQFQYTVHFFLFLFFVVFKKNLDHIHFPIFLGPLPLACDLPWRKEKEEEKRKK